MNAIRSVSGYCLVALAMCAAPVLAQPPRPNVIVILADDLGYGDLGCYGHKTFKTPNLDQLAAAGARLTSFNTPAPYCAPTRASLQTGRYQFRSGMTGNPVPKADPAGNGKTHDLGLPACEITLGESLQKAGYQTMLIGKWHLGHLPPFYPTRNGYHNYFGILYSNDMHPVELFDDEKVVEYPVVQATLTRRYTERSIQFIEKNKDRPFFLCLCHAMPHKPLAASEAFYKKSGNGLYADVIAELDAGMGQVLAKLKELKLDEQTLVVFTSDNGPWYGGSTAGLRGMKGLTFEGGLRVPMLARWPGKIPAGHVSHEPAIMMDLFPTILKACGAAVPTDRPIDGRDILPLLTSNAKSPHEATFSMRAERLHTVRSGPWKLHVVPPAPAKQKAWKPEDKWVDPRAPDGVRLLAPYEQAHPSQFPGLLSGDPVTGLALFDLKNDPAEQRNVADKHPEEVKRMLALFEKMDAEVKAQKR